MFLFLLNVPFQPSPGNISRNWRRQTTIATWTQIGQTDRPSENSFKASATSNGDRDKDRYHSDFHLKVADLTFTSIYATD